MRIFLSYASQDREVAAEINASLCAQGFDVFFDRADLSAGKEYDGRIRDEIQASDLFVFLVSPFSLKDRRYSLTELELVKKRWSNPSGKVLPVMVRPTFHRKLDAYLRAVTVLSTQGNIAAAVGAAIHDLGSPADTASLLAPGDAELQRERIAAYKKLWQLMNVLPKWPKADNVHYHELLELSGSLRDWYFSEGAGMFLSRGAQIAYAALQDSLTAILAEAPTGIISDDHYDGVRELCSALRSRLARDIGARS